MRKGRGSVCVKCFDAFSFSMNYWCFSSFHLPTTFFVLTICSGNLNWILYFYTYKRPIQYLLSKPFKKCETLSTFSYVHTRRKMLVGFGVAVMISCWLLYASLVKNEEERGVKLLNNLILVPFFCIINLSLYFNNSRKGGKCGSKNT